MTEYLGKLILIKQSRMPKIYIIKFRQNTCINITFIISDMINYISMILY